MADEKFNIEVAVKAQLDSLNKIQDAIGEINQKLKGFSYFLTAPSEAFSSLYWENGEAFKFFASNLLALENPSDAKVICNKIEGVLLLQEKNAKALTQIQALQKALTSRILDSKLVK